MRRPRRRGNPPLAQTPRPHHPAPPPFPPFPPVPAASGQISRTLTVSSTEPALQFYTGNFLDGTNVGKGGKKYPHRSAFVMEPEHYPDSPNHPAFPTTILPPNQTYHHTMTYAFGVVESK
ncbi:MAG: hypothetical protein JSS11_11070 [Verrucomicrobia bacterium]|nr:hypothetical protein [Verrucomicrobiota bacterium]